MGFIALAVSLTGCVDFNVECTPNVKDPEGLAGWLGRTETGAPLSLDKNDVRTGDHPLGQLLAESYFFAFDKVESNPSRLPRLGVENSGAIRSECRASLSSGRIRRRLLRQVIPFDNQIYGVPVTFPQLRRVFEHSVAGFQKAGNPANRSPPGSFLQVAGALIDVDCNQPGEEINADGSIKTPGQRIQKVSLLARNDPARVDCVINYGAGSVPNPCSGTEIWVAVNSFLYGGGDAYQVFKEVATGPACTTAPCPAGYQCVQLPGSSEKVCDRDKLSVGILNFNAAATHWAERYPDEARAFPGKAAPRHTFANCVLR